MKIKPSDLIGKKFGKLTVINIAGKDKQGTPLLFCNCECSGTKIIRKNQLLRGVGLHCGCSHGRKENIIGKKFGRLTVIAEIGKDKHGRLIYECICDCGKIKNTLGMSLKDHTVRSCGCYNREASSKRNALPFGEASFNSFFSVYRYGAKRRKIEFELTKEKFRELTQMHCFYCGDTTEKKYISHKAEHKKTNGHYTYISGIDRLDNTKGYTIENCVPCCFRCNRGKTTQTIQELIIWFTGISSNLFLLKQKLIEKGFLNPETQVK